MIFTQAFKVRVALKSILALTLGCEGVLIVKFAQGGRSINLIRVDQPMQIHWNRISNIYIGFKPFWISYHASSPP